MPSHAPSIVRVPRIPAVYAMFGGEGVGRQWVAYVGIAGNLRSRLEQHFIRRDSSVVTGASAVGVNVEHVRYVDWWTHALFEDDDRRHAAELVAFDVLDPALRSRGRPREAALGYLNDQTFVDAIRKALSGPAAGRLVLPKVADLGTAIADLQRRVEALERRASEKE
jgi:hypothetical protein